MIQALYNASPLWAQYIPYAQHCLVALSENRTEAIKNTTLPHYIKVTHPV